MKDEYFMINGRGYPDTVDDQSLYCSESGTPCDREGSVCGRNETNICVRAIQPPDVDDWRAKASQRVHSLITANQGERVLLRVSNLNVTTFNTLMSPSIPMTVVGRDAKQLQDPAGDDLYYTTTSVTLGGGMSMEVILDTTDVAPGTYFLYSSNLYQLANHNENEDGLGGMLTEIVIQ
jgi:FtsP/CotA-like multicopper oxidase with cupredoxin domain